MTNSNSFAGARRHRIDIGAAVVHELYYRKFHRPRDVDCDGGGVGGLLQPNKAYARMLGLPSSSGFASKPHTSACTLFCHTCINKSRCPVNVVRWTRDGRRLIAGSHLGEFTLWSASNGFSYEKLMTAHESPVRSMSWSSSGEWLVSGDAKGIVKYWNASLMLSKEMKVHTASVRGVAFAPSDAKFATCSDDLEIKVVDFATAKEEVTLKGHGWDVKTISWHPQKSLLLSGAKDNNCKLWCPQSGKEICTVSGHKNTVNAVGWNPHNGRWFFSASRDQTVRIYDLRKLRKGGMRDGEALGDGGCVHVLSAHDAEVYSAQWHPVHETLLSTGGYNGSLIHWTVGMESEPALQAAVPAAHENAIWAMDWHPAGHLLCTGSNDHTTKFWARPRPGMVSEDLYRGFNRDFSELDWLRQTGLIDPDDDVDEGADQDESKQSETTIPGLAVPAAKPVERVGIVLDPPHPSRKRQRVMKDFSGGKSTLGMGCVPGQVASTVAMPTEFAPKPKADISNLQGPRSRGTVKKWFERGYGFIIPDTPGEELYAHASDILQGYGTGNEQRFEPGDRVEFRLGLQDPTVATASKQYRAKDILRADFVDPSEKRRTLRLRQHGHGRRVGRTGPSPPLAPPPRQQSALRVISGARGGMDRGGMDRGGMDRGGMDHGIKIVSRGSSAPARDARDRDRDRDRGRDRGRDRRWGGRR